MLNQRIRFKSPEGKGLVRLKDFAGAVQLAAADAKDPSMVKVQVLRTGAWEHPWYGSMIITQQTLADMVRNFADNVRRQDLPIDYFHESEREAAGWVRNLYIEQNGSELWADVQVTPRAKQMLADKEIRYFSADFYFEWTDPETGVSYKNVLNGGGFVNRPFVKDMEPVAELSEGNKMKTVEQLNAEIKTLGEQMSAKDSEIKTLGEAVKAKDSEIAELKGKVAAAAKEKELSEKEASFKALCDAGKACAAQHDAYMAGDMVKFAELAQPLNPKPAGSTEGGGTNAPVALTEEEKAICKKFNLTEEEFRKHNK